MNDTITFKSKHKGMQLGQAPQAVMTLGLIALLLGATTLALSQFKSSITDNTTTEWLATDNASKGLTNLSLQLPTVGTIIGVALIIGVVVGAFYMFGKK